MITKYTIEVLIFDCDIDLNYCINITMVIFSIVTYCSVFIHGHFLLLRFNEFLIFIIFNTILIFLLFILFLVFSTIQLL